MTQPRSKIVDPSISRWYHCVSRCVRNAFLLSDERGFDRKDWFDRRIRYLDSVFAVSVAGFCVMNNHLHLLLRIDPEVAEAWSPEEIARRWFELFPPRSGRQIIPVTQELIDLQIADLQWIEVRRKRLASLSWFMKMLKEPLSRLANREENCRGAFFEGRFKSIAILDEESLLAVATYIDLNPVAASIESLPEESLHTSIRERVLHIIATGRLQDVSQIRNGSVAAQEVSEGIEDELWLVPIEDRRSKGSKREGIKVGFTLGQYLQLVDCVGRMTRKGKRAINAEEQSIFDRLAINAKLFATRLEKMTKIDRFYGCFMATTRETLARIALKIGMKRLVNTA